MKTSLFQIAAFGLALAGLPLALAGPTAASLPIAVSGDGPFLTPGDFSTPNEAYFHHADWVIRRAEEKGIIVFLFPCYWGATPGATRDSGRK